MTIPPASTPSPSDGGIVDDAKWTHGDALLLSTDGVRFRVPSKLLLSVRQVAPPILLLFLPSDLLRSSFPSRADRSGHFRHQSSAATTTWKPQASAFTIRYFLSSAKDGFTVRDDWARTDALRQLVLLLAAWDCQALLDDVVAAVLFAIESDEEYSLVAFVVAATASRPDAAATVMERGRGRSWKWPPCDRPTPLVLGRPGEAVLDPAGWPAYMWTQCPPVYAYALARSWLERKNGDGAKATAGFKAALTQGLASASTNGKLGDASEADLVMDDTWTDGDWELVSADGVCFRVPSYYLLAVSSVFRDLADLPSPQRSGKCACQAPPAHSITFFDTEFETAATLRLLLHFIIEGELCPPGPPSSSSSSSSSSPPSSPGRPRGQIDYTLTGVRELVLFLRKWQASPTLSHVLLLLERGVAEGTVCSLRALIVAAAIENAALVSAVVGKQDAFFTAREEDVEEAAERGAVGVSVWNPGAWPLCMWTKCARGHAVALARAWGETQRLGSRGYAFPKAFERWLAEVVA